MLPKLENIWVKNPISKKFSFAQVCFNTLFLMILGFKTPKMRSKIYG